MRAKDSNEDICSMCEAEPQDMLILSCRHNLCLECATEVYNLNSKEDKIICEICLSQTSLDNDTIVCLRSLSAKGIKQQKMGLNNDDKQMQQSENKYPPMPRSQYQGYNQKLPLIQEQQGLGRCQKHGQPLTYYCLECNFHKICSECMLLQGHRYHKVVTLRKASVHIKQVIEKVGREKIKLKNMLEKDRESLQLRREQSEKQLERNLVEMKSAFDEVMRMVGRKYQELSRIMEQQASRKLQIMEGAINQIQKKITLIEQTVKFQDELIYSSFKNQFGGMFQMFEYYQSQIAQSRLDFEPSLPNFISQVCSQTLANKQNVFVQIEQLLEQLIVGSKEQENINLISQIDNQNYDIANEIDTFKQKTPPYAMKRRYFDQENIQITNGLKSQKPISQNINIIQLGSYQKKGINQRKQTSSNTTHIKRSKESIQAIKKKARQNIRDRQMSHSRKMELSRSIQNATDILNKIQERSSRA